MELLVCLPFVLYLSLRRGGGGNCDCDCDCEEEEEEEMGDRELHLLLSATVLAWILLSAVIKKVELNRLGVYSMASFSFWLSSAPPPSSQGGTRRRTGGGRPRPWRKQTVFPLLWHLPFNNNNAISSCLLLSLPVSLLVLSLHLSELCVLLACGWGSKVVRLVAVGSALAIGERDERTKRFFN